MPVNLVHIDFMLPKSARHNCSKVLWELLYIPEYQPVNVQSLTSETKKKQNYDCLSYEHLSEPALVIIVMSDMIIIQLLASISYCFVASVIVAIGSLCLRCLLLVERI